jgi:peptide/nickel transport system permease protein
MAEIIENPLPQLPETPLTTRAEDQVAVATQWQLMWWRFRKHRVAMSAAIVLIMFYFVVIAADFLAYSSPEDSDAFRSLLPPQPIYLFDDGAFRPHVYAMESARDPRTLRRVFVPNPEEKIYLRLFAEGYEYRFLGLFKTNIHLLGVEDSMPTENALFLLGTDQLGRDLFSRLMLATRVSLTIGLVGVALSLIFGVILGGISGYFGGLIDTLIQRLIEILRSVPSIPLWMGLAAALPRNWDVLRVYFAITIILSLIGWTGLARVVRGKFLSLREEDFVTAARLTGCSEMRIIFRHLLPSFTSHVIASATLALPIMIVSETALSFLGLGLRPPAISWGVLLQDAQNVQAIALTPWLLIPAVPVIIAILAFNFLGDGLRDAADPYGN